MDTGKYKVGRYPIQGRVEILYLLYATETGDECKSDGPLGSYANFLGCSLNMSKP